MSGSVAHEKPTKRASYTKHLNSAVGSENRRTRICQRTIFLDNFRSTLFSRYFLFLRKVCKFSKRPLLKLTRALTH